MRTRFFFSLLLSFPFYLLSSQVPQGFNYMAIARDIEGNILPNQNLEVVIGILSGIDPVTIVWEEVHKTTTNNTGLFRIIVGDPEAERLETSTVLNFKDIEWQMQPLYIRTIVNDLEMGIAQLFSVPYAMVAGSAYNGIGNPFDMNGDTVVFLKSVDVVGDNPLTEDALFEVKRQDGQSMFAVYNQGVRINVPLIDDIKGAKGGFAIGGFGASKGVTYDLFTLNKDSARIYLDKTPDLTKGKKGGFSIGGFAVSDKGVDIQEYLTVTPDSTRVYVNQAAKASKGGFAIGGFGAAKGEPSVNFMNITKENYFIGHEAGSKRLDAGLYNSVIGYQAARNLTTGLYNTILGYKADSSLTNGENNIIIGATAGFKLTSGNHNTLIGSGAGYNHTSQQYNVMIGTTAGYNVTGSYNTFMGINAGYKIISGIENTFLGTNAGAMLEEGNGNTIIGIDAGRSGTWDPGVYHTGFVTSNNTIVGNQAGYSLNVGSGNVFIGYKAGYSEAGTVSVPVSNKLYINNASANPPLIYGDFTSKKLGINTRTLTANLNVGGDANVTGTITAGSVSAPLTGNVSGNVTGSLTGNVTGNVSGSAGNVGGVTMGIINMTSAGIIVSARDGQYDLYWDKTNSKITARNTNSNYSHVWWQGQQGSTPVGGALALLPTTGSYDIITGLTTNSFGYGIHFGDADGGAAYCSVWIQYSNGRLVGHYIKY